MIIWSQNGFRKKDIKYNLSDMEMMKGNGFRVCFVLVDGFALMSYSACVEPLRAANKLAGREIYVWSHICADGIVAVSSTGVRVHADFVFGDHPPFDLVLVVAGGDPVGYKNAQLSRWLRQMATQNISLGGVSGGPVLLAKAAVMAGAHMTVHWEHATALAELLPEINLKKSRYIIDKDRYTCAGGIAPLDMMLALITNQHGVSFARKVADWFLHTSLQSGDDPQRAGIVERYNVHNIRVVNAINLMSQNLSVPLRLNMLADSSGVHPRQLTRLFVTHLGKTPMAVYRELRLTQSRQLLKQTALSITEIGYATGFSSGAHFCQAYRQFFGFAPSLERKQGKRAKG